MAAKDAYQSLNRRFASSPKREALYLLRPVRRYAHIGESLSLLPEPLQSLVGEPTSFDRSALLARLTARGVNTGDLGGPLTDGVSTASDGSGERAKYFVIHDTSDASPARPFPPHVDTAAWPPNNVGARSDRNKAHMFIGRTGATTTGNNYSQRKLATKFERSEFPTSIGLFLHHELVQPRLDDPATSSQDDALAPTPGFTALQYERLAQAYLAASLRRQMFLIPAYHAVLDEDIPNGHDDPQNFDLNAWAAALQTELTAVTNMVPAPAPIPVPATGQNQFSPLVTAYAAHIIGFPNLKAITLAQWMLESGRGESELSKRHLNFAGMKYRPEMAGLATPVTYAAHDGEDIYCKFASLEQFIDGYWRFLERSPYWGWKEHAGSPGDFINFIGETYSGSAGYAADVLGLLPEAEAMLAAARAAGPILTGDVLPVFQVDSPDGTLNLRSAPSATAPILAVLPHGQAVSMVEAGVGTQWGRVRTTLSGAVHEGFVARRFLVSVATPTPAPLHTNIVPIHLVTSRTIRRSETTGRAYPLSETGQPRRDLRADAAARVQSLERILDWLDVENEARYRSSGETTFCNIYAYDYCYLAGAYLPRVWWSQAALVRLARGESVPARYEDTVRELTANQLSDWFEEFGADFGWQRVAAPGDLQRAAEGGGVGVIVAQRTDLDRPGHICVTVPADGNHAAQRDGSGTITVPVQSQSGATNHKRFVAKWWNGPKFRKFSFWTHA